MGFINFEYFNKDMIVKLVWRLHTDPKDLMAKLLKAKYYPKFDILEVKIGRNLSYLWRGIQSNIWVTKKGSYWNVGNGSYIKVWEDNWVHSLCRFKFLT